MSTEKKRKTLSIRITVLGVFLIVAGATAGLSLGLQYYFSAKLAKTAAKDSFRTTSDKVSERIQALDRQSSNMVEVIGHFLEIETFPGPQKERRSLPLLGGAMRNNPSIYAIYVGYGTGEFFELVNLESSPIVRKSFEAAPHDRWVVIKINTSQGIRKKTTLYLDASFNVRHKKETPTDYDPRTRPWYTKAKGAAGTIKTKPYIFTHLKASGVTYAKYMKHNPRVVAVDISLEGLSGFLKKQQFLDRSQAFLFDKKGNIIASAPKTEKKKLEQKGAAIDLSQAEKDFIAAHPVIRASNQMDWPPFDFAMSGSPRGYSVELLNLLAKKAGLQVAYVNGYSWEELTALFKKGELDLLHSLIKTPERDKMGVFTRPYIPMPQAWAVKKTLPFPDAITSLNNRTIAIPKGWATEAFLKENYPQIKRYHVASPLDALRAVSSGSADAALDSLPVLDYIAASYFLDDLKIGGSIPELNSENQGLHFMAHPDKAILANILDKALLALAPKESDALNKKWFEKGKSDAAAQKTMGTVPHRSLLDIAATADSRGELRPMTINGREHFGYVARIESFYDSDEYIGLTVPVEEALSPYMVMIRFSLLFTLGLLVLLVPIVWYCATIIVKPINDLALESRKVKNRQYQDVGMVKSRITEILGLSRSMVSMATAIKAYEESLKELMDSFIKLIATAIDQKSPYTGGHCARVPELSVMLAKAASDSSSGALADFSFTTEEQWREYRTAAWLHDCGKVATPEYIVDKATKLETINNRIHEVRMRFEVLLRDAVIHYLKKKAEGGDKDTLKKELAEKQQAIRDDFAFIAECNLGGEFMAEEKVARVEQIAEKRWTRYLDDRLGLGHIELMRYPENTPDLPCEEPLLADRPEHIIERPPKGGIGGSGEGFAMEVPEHLYNLGEIYNLCISRGTLTAEDRYIIQEHITTTIQMLETLPYPENMTRIPEYAGAHHETLLGTGYPRKLTAEQIGIPARIMAVADIFEALTASDRPYKEAKKLSQAIRILSFMVKDGHLDGDIFRLFLESGVYLEYAKKFLDPAQIDEVDLTSYI